MSKLSKEFKKLNPTIQTLLKQILLAILFGGSAQREELQAAYAELDSDGDGVPDSEDEAPHDASNNTRKPRVKAAK